MWIRTGLLVVVLAACGGGGGPQSRCGDNKCDGSERCESCPSDCGTCNVCGDGKCSVTEVENCSTCAADCKCPDILVCARELTLPPRCILPTAVACANGAQPRPFTFCLVQPDKRIDDCINRFETTVTACTRDEAAAIAQSTAANYILRDGACPPCCASPPCQ
jgi:hypothetical protein